MRDSFFLSSSISSYDRTYAVTGIGEAELPRKRLSLSLPGNRVSPVILQQLDRFVDQFTHGNGPKLIDLLSNPGQI